jgi:hypothetical protein
MRRCGLQCRREVAASTPFKKAALFLLQVIPEFFALFALKNARDNESALSRGRFEHHFFAVFPTKVSLSLFSDLTAFIYACAMHGPISVLACIAPAATQITDKTGFSTGRTGLLRMKPDYSNIKPYLNGQNWAFPL